MVAASNDKKCTIKLTKGRNSEKRIQLILDGVGDDTGPDLPKIEKSSLRLRTWTKYQISYKFGKEK